MNIVKVNPFLQGKSFTNLLDDVFNRSISDLVGSDFAVTTPSVNVSEDNENVVLDFSIKIFIKFAISEKIYYYKTM